MMPHRKRGRPRLYRTPQDLGTPELQDKREQHLTAEPLDLLYHKGLITSAQHQAGVRLRWLHSLRFGVPRTQAYNPEYLKGQSTCTYNPVWLASRNQEYRVFCRILEEEGVYRPVSDMCIHLRPPLSLSPIERGLEALARYRRNGRRSLFT